jgi:hypothetical protein
MSRSQNNNKTNPLDASGTEYSVFTGTAEHTLDCVAISVSIIVPTPCLLTIQQTYDKVNWFITESFTVPAGEHRQYQQTASLEYFRVILTNLGGLQSYCHMISTRSQSLTQNVNIRNLTLARDNVNVEGTVDISGTANVAVTNFPATQLVSGQNSPYAFYPTAANNIPEIYADGTKGTNVTGGWQYTNEITGKINWYCYGSPTSATDYKLSQLQSMYTVINQQSTLGLAQAQNPFIIVYTRPTGDGDALWYKSKFFFGGENTHTDISGTKILYTGEDPVDIHPEITGINRIQLAFKLDLSTKTLAAGADESIWTGSLQTTNATTPAGSFNFTMLEFGAVWDTVDSVLPVEFGRVKCDVVGTVGLTPSITTATYNQAVSAVSFTGTAFDMGENSLVDVLLLASGAVTNVNVRLDYSTDGITWFPNNTTTYSITTTDLHNVILGLKTGSRYIRVSTGPSSAFRADNLRMTFTSKRN